MRSLSTKIVALSFAAALAAGLVGGGVLIAIMLDVSGAQVRSLEAALRANFDRNARTEVETAVSLLAAVEKVAGRPGAEAATRKLAADLVRELRYDKTGYFWIDDAKGNNIVLLGNKTEGTNRYEAKDTRGNLYMQSIIRQGLAGGGYSDYWFPKAGQT